MSINILRINNLDVDIETLYRQYITSYLHFICFSFMLWCFNFVMLWPMFCRYLIMLSPAILTWLTLSACTDHKWILDITAYRNGFIIMYVRTRDHENRLIGFQYMWLLGFPNRFSCFVMIGNYVFSNKQYFYVERITTY
jgi:hypothetical protein